MVPTSPRKARNLKRVLENPGILLKFWKSLGKVMGILSGQTVQKRDF